VKIENPEKTLRQLRGCHSDKEFRALAAELLLTGGVAPKAILDAANRTKGLNGSKGNLVRDLNALQRKLPRTSGDEKEAFVKRTLLGENRRHVKTPRRQKVRKETARKGQQR